MIELQQCIDEINRRDAGPTEIRTDRKGRPNTLKIVDRITRDDKEYVIARVTGWQYYSRRSPNRYREIAYLCGYDDNGFFARRIPGSITLVVDAFDRLEPAAVSRARSAGRRVWRQGDLYAIEMRRDLAEKSYRALSPDVRATHIYNPTGRTLRHVGGHAHIRFGKIPIKFVEQNITAAFGGAHPRD